MWKCLPGTQNFEKEFVVCSICDMLTGNILMKLVDTVYDGKVFLIKLGVVLFCQSESA